MPVITYIAKSSIAVGHIAGQTYSVAFGAKECVPESRIDRTQPRSISGKIETTVRNRWREWSIQTVPTDAQTMEQLIEFIDSAMDGSSFVFDELATSLDADGNPVSVNPRECQLIDEQARATQSMPGRTLYTVSFSIREKTAPKISVNHYFDLDLTRDVNPAPDYFVYSGSATVPMYVFREDGKYYQETDDRPWSHYDCINNREMGTWFGRATGNIALWSADISNAAWATQNATKSAANAMFVSNGVAQRLTVSAGGGGVYQTLGTFTANTNDVLWAIVEKGDTDIADIGIWDATAGTFRVRATLTYSTGAIVFGGGSDTGAAIRAVKLLNTGFNGGAVYIIAVTTTATGVVGGNSRRVIVYPAGYASTSGFGYLHYVHANYSTANTCICPPIVTQGASASRPANSLMCSVIPAWMHGREYTLGATFNIHDPTTIFSSTSRYFVGLFSDNATNDRAMLYQSNSGAMVAQSQVNNTTEYSQSYLAPSFGRHKLASRYKLNDCAVTMDAQTTKFDSVAAIPSSVSRLGVGAYTSIGSEAQCYISRAVFAPRAWTTNELQNWTAA